jgi:oxygen-independent coproporphyrinogen III oxidase
MLLGLYVSVPFCRTKCSYCNFASEVFSGTVFQRYVDHVCSTINRSSETAEQMGGPSDSLVDTVYLGGGTPTMLEVAQLRQLFVTISQNFQVLPGAEITVECAPGTLSPEMLEALPCCRVNRVSLGVQSFVDIEAASVGRLHKRATVVDDLARLRSAGISNINIDLIAGLPHQTANSWQISVSEAISSDSPHISVYMLEADEDSRLGRELIAGGTRYHAHSVPDDDLTADLYLSACEHLEAAGVKQYEISNFAREGYESRHNMKYWTRQPYLGFGVDAHSMLPAASPREERDFSPAEDPQNCNLRSLSSVCSHRSVRFSTAGSLEGYLGNQPLKRTEVSDQAALEEAFFLGLRLTQGLDLRQVRTEFGDAATLDLEETITELVQAGMLSFQKGIIRLTSRGRLLSNEVFERFIKVGSGAI